MSDRSPIERFYDAASGEYLKKKLRMVSARLAQQVILDTVRDLPLGKGPWQVLDAGGGGGLYARSWPGLATKSASWTSRQACCGWHHNIWPRPELETRSSWSRLMCATWESSMAASLTWSWRWGTCCPTLLLRFADGRS